MKKIVWLGSIFALLVLGTGAVSAQSIRRIDFRNFSYRADCGGESGETVRVRNGEYSRDQGDDKMYFRVQPPAYGDLNGDSAEEAVINSDCNTGGTGDFSEGYIYTWRAGRLHLLTIVPGGDRADGGLHRLSIARGLVIVESYATKIEGVGICCPEFIDTRRYRWNGHRLVQVGKRQRRNYQAPQ